ncbi:Ankyrin repeat domain containing protein [Pandoravirus quercus]|uniref:Ankyrin repeat domain containing protein n=1 Tax=Pandoravirus quercus TaxID=2107709 RepID=A0A2U7U9X6_9VIRU|nr:Ankyrin repeat domain containing protein [Pandoravirus quercus]AVK75243.1 Ankyrin repeat domain containing protein [Pandoravirus quercus]
MEDTCDTHMTIEQDPGAMVGSVVSPHASSDVCEDVTLADLPREVLLHIVQFIERPSDLLAARMAARLFDMIDVARRAAEWAACPAHAGVVIRSRAPRDLIAKALPLYADHTHRTLLGLAVAGGRLDVVRLIHEFIESSAADAPCRLSRYDIYQAMCGAARGGHVDIVRYLLTRRIGNVHGRDCGWGVKQAAGTGNVDLFVFAHDVYSLPATSTKPCRCDAEVGRAAWDAVQPDVALWMRDFGCAGYCRPVFDQLTEALIQGHNSIEAIVRHMEPITDPELVQRLNNAVVSVNAGHHAAIMAAIDQGLPIDPTALLMGAASNNDIKALALVTDRFPPTRHMVRSAIVAVVDYNAESDGARWLAQQWPDAVDATLVTACIIEGDLSKVRALESVLDPPYDWQRAAGAVLASQDERLIAYAIEQKGVVLDESIVLTEGFVPYAPAVAYLIRHYGREHTQALYDMGAALWRRQQSCEVYCLEEVAEQGDLCVAAYAAMFWAHDRDHESQSAPTCACASCRGPDGSRPLKRRRVEPSSSPPPQDPLDDAHHE